MTGMEVHLNGSKLCTAGIGQDGVLSTMVTIATGNSHCDLEVRVGGLENEQFLLWSNCDLRIGDEIVIRIVEPTSIDEPVKKSNPYDPPVVT